MSELNVYRKRLMAKWDQLEKHPSTLTRDALLEELRRAYDSLIGLELNASPTLEQQSKEPEDSVVREKVKKPTQDTAPPEDARTPGKVETSTEEATEPLQPEPQATPIEDEVDTSEEPQRAASSAQETTEQEEPNTLADKFNRTPLEDLRSGIPLNEKFGIIRNLFDGNASDFGDAIIKLNNAANEGEMRHYLELLVQRFEWETEDNPSYQVLLTYVERRILAMEEAGSNTDTDQ